MDTMYVIVATVTVILNRIASSDTLGEQLCNKPFHNMFINERWYNGNGYAAVAGIKYCLDVLFLEHRTQASWTVNIQVIPVITEYKVYQIH
jgi:hypothetical protein